MLTISVLFSKIPTVIHSNLPGFVCLKFSIRYRGGPSPLGRKLNSSPDKPEINYVVIYAMRILINLHPGMIGRTNFKY